MWSQGDLPEVYIVKIVKMPRVDSQPGKSVVLKDFVLDFYSLRASKTKGTPKARIFGNLYRVELKGSKQSKRKYYQSTYYAMDSILILAAFPENLYYAQGCKNLPGSTQLHAQHIEQAVKFLVVGNRWSQWLNDKGAQ